MARNPYVAPPVKFAGRAIHLDRARTFARRGEVPLARQRRGSNEASTKATRRDFADVAHVVKTVLALNAPRSPFGLADPSHVEGCHLCSVYQVSGFATILHKRVGGLLPPPFVKGRSA